MISQIVMIIALVSIWLSLAWGTGDSLLSRSFLVQT